MARKKETLNGKTIIRLMISLAGIMFLFGLSWLFAALTITVPGVRLTFQILFTIFASLQGFFVFLFFCAFSKDARELWKEALSCGRYKSTPFKPTLMLTSDKTGSGYSNKSTSISTLKGSENSIIISNSVVSQETSSIREHSLAEVNGNTTNRIIFMEEEEEEEEEDEAGSSGAVEWTTHCIMEVGDYRDNKEIQPHNNSHH